MTSPRFILNKEKENLLLKKAKQYYKDYSDIKNLAEELELTGGQVYLTLKQHSFIKQNETTEYRVADAYYRCNGNLRRITEETGLSVWICAKTLEKIELSPNWASYRKNAEEGKVGSLAEEEFKKLVPFAIDMNDQFKMNNPNYDFVFNEKTIDVKSSTLHRGAYAIRTRQHPQKFPDFFCCFLVKDKEKEFNSTNYSILLIPNIAIPKKNTSNFVIAPKNNTKAKSVIYWDFEVQPNELANILAMEF